MRVTKLIREYVEKEVASAMPYGEPTEIYRENLAKANAAVEEINKKITTFAEQLIGEIDWLPEGCTVKVKPFRTCVEFSSYNSPMEIARNNHEKIIREKRRKAIDQILLSLELGATKAELASVMKEIIKEITAE